MLPVEKFIKSNFVDGIKFNPEQIQLSNKYYEEKLGLANSYGIGIGILVGFKDSLKVVIDGDKIVVKPGALIDNEGNMIYVDKEHIIIEGLSNRQYHDKKSIYIYIRHTTRLDDLQESKYSHDVKIHYKMIDTYQILLQEKTYTDKTVVELARIYIDSKEGHMIKMPQNPYNPTANEIDISFAPKVVAKNTLINYEEKGLITSVLRQYGNFLNELGFRKRVLTATQVASFAYKIAMDIKTTDITPWHLHDMLYELLNLTLEIYKEKEEIINTALWKNVTRLQSIFNFVESNETDYYEINLDIDVSFFSKVITHYSSAAVFNGDWDSILKEEVKVEEKEERDYLTIGSGENCDIVVDGEDIAREHAKLYQYPKGMFIEEMPDSSGVYINAERLERGVRQLVKLQDFVVLGKNGKILNLQNL